MNTCLVWDGNDTFDVYVVNFAQLFNASDDVLALPVGTEVDAEKARAAINAGDWQSYRSLRTNGHVDRNDEPGGEYVWRDHNGKRFVRVTVITRHRIAQALSFCAERQPDTSAWPAPRV